MKKLASALLLAGLMVTALLLGFGGMAAAQTPPKGPDATPAPSISPTPAALDRALLPKIEPQLLKQLLATPAQPVPFIVYLTTQTDPAAAVAALGQADAPARRAALVTSLQQTAQRTQAGVLAALQNPSGAGLTAQAAADIHPLWVVNAVAARGSLELALALAARPEVQVVRLDKPVTLQQPQAMGRGDALPGFPVATASYAVAGQHHLAGAWGYPGYQTKFLLPQEANPATAPTTLMNILACKNAPLRPNLFSIDPTQNSTFRNQASPEWGIAKIRADLVQAALGYNGAGVVVANIDSGVDWQHPALQSQYRGYTGPGKLPQHPGNWFDATGAGAAYPVDGNGHGTHTMGTMVGSGGLGVAPGAQWIAARAFDSTGTALNSWLHLAFQWVLAPNGNPALAPDVVNNSWGSSIGSSTEFLADVQALLAAGIFPVFSAGNNGPAAYSVGSPGSLTSAFAVGATTLDDEIAIFSSRGPSPWEQIKPNVSAPGKDVRSSLPGGAFAEFDGTSMAAPHVSGLAALLLQASPALSNSPNAMAAAITSTAVALGSPIPNNNFGWGRIDAYNAVMAVAPVGVMQGSVTGGGSPLNGAVVQIRPRSNPGLTINVTTNSDGAYAQGLAAGLYDATAAAFGYQSATAMGVNIVTGTATLQNFNLAASPTGILSGTVRDSSTGLPLTATIAVDGTSATTAANTAGRYSLSLPTGVYSVTVTSPRHRLGRAANLIINDGGTVVQDFYLDPAPHILLVDGGRWYQESQIGYYQQTLTDLRYPYDLWPITNPFSTPNDVPTAATLAPYDVVIWSAPLDSPGYVGAGSALTAYLDSGKKLLLSGQDVAYYDGGGSLFGSSAYFTNYLKAVFVQDSAGVLTATGVTDQPFDGLTLTLAGGDGADNQYSPDVIAITQPDFAGPLLTYGDGKLAGQHIGLCVPYRAMLLSFGFEGINSRVNRQAVMSQTLAWLQTAPPAAGVELSPLTGTVVAGFGDTATHTVRLRNTGAQAGTFTVTRQSVWPVSPLPGSVLLAACQSQTLTMGVTVNTAGWHVSDTLTLTAVSGQNPALTAVATRISKSPAPVLLVDDDRWYSFAAEFKAALAANGVPYDYWLVPKSWSGAVPPSPPTATLALYPMVVWYTAYDWFQPLTTAEENRLAAYLNGGGRLMFSGQDYIYGLPDHRPSPFAVNYLGVLSHTEDFSSTAVTGQAGSPVGNHLGPYPLTFPPGYSNWTDALTPTAQAQIASRGPAGQPNAVSLAGSGSGGQAWHSLFLAWGPELLSSPDRARFMQRSVGWLSWLGKSTVTPSVTAALDGQTMVFTATLINDGPQLLPAVTFTATRPAELTWGAASAGFNPAGSALRWDGSLAAGQTVALTYSASIAGGLPPGTEIKQTSWLAYPEHRVQFDRIATVKVNFPDLSGSELRVNPAQNVAPGDTLTYTLVLRNSGLVDAPRVTATNTLLPMLDLAGANPPAQGSVQVNGRSLTWTTAISTNEALTLTYRVVISYRSSTAIENTAYVDDGFSPPQALTTRATFKPRPVYLPLIFKN